MIRKLPTLVLIDCMAYVRIGSLYRYLSGLFCDRFFLRLEFHVELGTPMHPRTGANAREKGRHQRLIWNRVHKLMIYLNPIFQLDFPTCINTDMLQGLAGYIIGFPLGLQGLEDRRLVDPSRAVGTYGTRLSRKFCILMKRQDGSFYLLEPVDQIKHFIAGYLWIFPLES